MEDRLTRGLIAGIIAGIVMDIYSFAVYDLNLSTLRYPDWSGIVIFNHTPPFQSWELVLATITQIFFTGVMGIVFTYLIPQVTSRNFLLKGWLYGSSIWFAIDIFDTLFKVDGLGQVPFLTAVTNYIGAAIFGLVLAEVIILFTNKSRSVA